MTHVGATVQATELRDQSDSRLRRIETVVARDGQSKCAGPIVSVLAYRGIHAKSMSAACRQDHGNVHGVLAQERIGFSRETAGTFAGQLLVKPFEPAIDVPVRMAMPAHTAPSLLTRHFIKVLRSHLDALGGSAPDVSTRR